ncbi:Uncharacterised protein [Klebsiella michiganensis]|uniref:Uncharacterized protein n=1 Tax=Klebsiella michiganensis TaxID=1134687 RepID=A0A7H4MUY9_9ENTR|nr:Uncharacterised protein [Klebsiella michiganensis]
MGPITSATEPAAAVTIAGRPPRTDIARHKYHGGNQANFRVNASDDGEGDDFGDQGQRGEHACQRFTRQQRGRAQYLA